MPGAGGAAMPAVDEDRFLYWPVLIAFGCPILCVFIWSGALFSAPWPSVRIVLQFIIWRV
jgi:hypothetical protein